MSPEDHNVWEEFVSSVVSDDHSSEPLSPEDAAWVDSCLVKDPDLSESDWDAMKDALVDIIGHGTPSDHSNSVAQNGSPERESNLDVQMSEVTQSPFGAKDNHVEDTSVQYVGFTDDDFGPTPEKEESGLPRGFLLKGKSKFVDPNRDKKTKVDPELSLANEREFPREEIFKIWDLNTPSDEADEFVNQLEKALEGTPHTTEPLAVEYSTSDLDLGTLEDLISGFADMSLHPLSAS